MTPEQLAPFIKAEIESIKVDPDYPALKPRQLVQAYSRAIKKAWQHIRDERNKS